jgi:DNA-binding CsgD family transcriptional regulator
MSCARSSAFAVTNSTTSGPQVRASGQPIATASAGHHWSALTPQEFQVARVVAEGRTNDEAAAALFVSRKTVENHLTRVYRKLGMRSRSDLVRLFPGA